MTTKKYQLYFLPNQGWETVTMVTLLFVWMPLLSFKCELALDTVLCQDYQNYIRNTFFFLLVMHLLLAVLATMLCEYMECQFDLTLKWTGSVFIHGFLAFRLLCAMLFDFESQKQQEPLADSLKHGLQDLAQ